MHPNNNWLRNRLIVWYLFHHKATYENAAKHFGLSKERIRQIYHKYVRQKRRQAIERRRPDTGRMWNVRFYRGRDRFEDYHEVYYYGYDDITWAGSTASG